MIMIMPLSSNAFRIQTLIRHFADDDGEKKPK